MRRVLVVAVLAGAALLLAAEEARAQTPPAGVVSGVVRNGTAGAPTPAVTVQLIAILPSGQIGAQSVETRDGTFRFSAPADPAVTYLLRTEYAGIPYLEPVPILLAPEALTIERTITVWETTDVRPSLRIARTTVYVEGLDGATGRLQLRREDVVEHPGDRVYVGGADRRTLRLPTPDGAVAVDEEPSFDGTVTLEQGVVVTTQPLRPGRTLVRTRLLTEYDVRSAEYALRVTAPLPTAAMEVHAPTSLVGSVRPVADAEVARPVDADGERWQVTRRTAPAAEGESMVVLLRGLSGLQATNPLTSPRGAAIGVAVALAVVAIGALAAARARGRDSRGRRMTAAIEVRALTKRYGGAMVLDRLTFVVEPGTKVALTGANGAGKSTLLAVLGTLVSASSGSFAVAGCEAERDGAALRRSIGVLAHSPMVYEELTPLENLRFFARLYGVEDGEARAQALLERVGLGRRRHEPTRVLSRGMHQRLAIARALVHRPSVLLLDEPETGLDTEGLDVLDQELLQVPGVTVLAATHQIGRSTEWADARITLHRGRIAAAEGRGVSATTAAREAVRP